MSGVCTSVLVASFSSSIARCMPRACMHAAKANAKLSEATAGYRLDHPKPFNFPRPNRRSFTPRVLRAAAYRTSHEAHRRPLVRCMCWAEGVLGVDVMRCGSRCMDAASYHLPRSTRPTTAALSPYFNRSIDRSTSADPRSIAERREGGGGGGEMILTRKERKEDSPAAAARQPNTTDLRCCVCGWGRSRPQPLLGYGSRPERTDGAGRLGSGEARSMPSNGMD